MIYSYSKYNFSGGTTLLGETVMLSEAIKSVLQQNPKEKQNCMSNYGINNPIFAEVTQFKIIFADVTKVHGVYLQ